MELWRPGDDVALADKWRVDVERAIAEADGLTVDRYVDHPRGIVLLRVRARPKIIGEIAGIDEIATIDLVPQAPPVLMSALEASLDEIPEADAPSEDAPLVAVVDSGINASHPLLVKSVYEAITLLHELSDGTDDHGHGTAVAGVLVNGPSEDCWLSGGDRR
ncbi:MAG TPA: S8 family serine peptidase [Gaiellaceae bacterium]